MEPFYDNSGITLYNADCLKALRYIESESVDAVVSDPPFTFAGGISNGRSSMADSQFFQHWLVSVFREVYRVSKPTAPWFLWSDWRTATVYDEALQEAAPDYHEARHVSQVLIHDREGIGLGSPFRNGTDWIVVIRGKKTDFGERIPKNQSNVLRHYWPYGKHEHHPSEKSVALGEQLIRWGTDEGDLVLDFCAGSGTVLIAAVNTNRRAIGIERERGYAEIAMQRLAQMALPLGV